MTAAPPNPASLAETLNRAARRIFQAERQPDWSSAVIDAAAGFCESAALFTVQGSRLDLERASVPMPGGVSVSPSEAPAVAHALESLEPVASAWSVRELSAPLVECFGSPRSGRVFLFPITSVRRSVALLAATGPAADLSGLELVATMAGASWELQRSRNDRAAAASKELISLAPKPSATPAEDAEWHQRARRFASVRVAELRLYQAAKVREGRDNSNLYDLFREEIDHDRATFQTQFLEKCASMTDYMNEELVRTLAQGEAGRMGENYPGAMVRR